MPRKVQEMSDRSTQISDDRRETLPNQGGADRPKAHSIKPLALLWPYVRKHLTLVFVALFFLVVSTLAALSIPWLFGRAVAPPPKRPPALPLPTPPPCPSPPLPRGRGGGSDAGHSRYRLSKKNPKAKEALDKEWRKLWKMKT